MFAANVATLPKRLDYLLSLSYSLYALSEVRLARAAQKSIARRAYSLGFSCAFSHSPPASPTFATSPGGTCILALRHLGLRKLHPELLSHWEAKGRVVCGVLATVPELIVACVYGFPQSHVDYHANDAMFAQIFSWASLQTCAVMLMGDWNQSISSCATLALSSQWGLFRLNDNTPSTMTKKHVPASSLPIDHAFANRQALDAACTMGVRQDIWVSDHYPLWWGKSHLSLFLLLPSRLVLASSVLSSPLSSFLGSALVSYLPNNLTEWNHAAQCWISSAFGIPVC